MTRGALLPWRLATAALIACALSGVATPAATGRDGAPTSAAASSAPVAEPGGTAGPASAAPETVPPKMSENPLGPIPPDDPRMESYSHGGYVLYAIGTIWGLLLLALFVGSGFGVWMQRLAERVTRRPNLKVAMYAAFYSLATFLGTFPLTVYAGFVREKRYGFANQSFGAWLGDQGKGLLVGVLLQALFFTALYAVLRRLPRLWWVAGSALAVLFVILVLAIAPVFIAPLFNTFEPLHDATLRDEILAMARARGIPAHEVYQVDASRQSEHNNAYVAGLLGTQRIVIYDTLLKHFTPREIRFVMGHEMGHYVLNHIWKFVAFLAVVIVIGFALVDRLARGVLARRPRLGIAALHEPASLPLLLLLLNLYILLVTPAIATFSRREEHQADRFGLEVTGDPEAAASSFLKFGTFDLSEYEVDPLIETVLYDHPSPANRIRYAQTWASRHPDRRSVNGVSER